MKGMKRKTIRKVLRNKIEDWLKSIDDPSVRQIAKENVIVTGGSITSMLLGEPINDFDIYLRTKESTIKLAKHYCTWFNKLNNPAIKPYVKEATIKNLKGAVEERVCIYVKSSGAAGEGNADEQYEYYEMTDNKQGDKAESYVDNLSMHGDKNPDDEGNELPKYRPVFMSQNAISLKNKVQFVIRFYGEPEQIHNNYDYIHAMCSYDYFKDELNMPGEALEAMMSRTLIYKGSLYPICSLFRMRKFIDRGWNITAGEILKISWQISEIDMTDPATLREQLTGCDVAYMHELIELLDNKRAEAELLGEDLKQIDAAYVVKLIDKVFNE